jgi:hypothetical protein
VEFAGDATTSRSALLTVLLTERWREAAMAAVTNSWRRE